MAREATMVLTQGREVRLVMPNLYAVLTGSGVPNPALAAILKLLDGEGLLEQQNLLARLHMARDNIRGLYEIAALCLAEPVLRLEGEPQAGEIGPADLAFGDLQLIYYSFFRDDPLPLASASGDRQPREGEERVPDGNGVQSEAVGLAGD